MTERFKKAVHGAISDGILTEEEKSLLIKIAEEDNINLSNAEVYIISELKRVKKESIYVQQKVITSILNNPIFHLIPGYNMVKEIKKIVNEPQIPTDEISITKEASTVEDEFINEPIFDISERFKIAVHSIIEYSNCTLTDKEKKILFTIASEDNISEINAQIYIMYVLNKFKEQSRSVAGIMETPDMTERFKNATRYAVSDGVLDEESKEILNQIISEDNINKINASAFIMSELKKIKRKQLKMNENIQIVECGTKVLDSLVRTTGVGMGAFKTFNEAKGIALDNEIKKFNNK